MIRNRLARLERLAAERSANCPGCRRIPARILLPGDPDPQSDTVTCDVCGREKRPHAVRIVVPGFRGPLVTHD